MDKSFNRKELNSHYRYRNNNPKSNQKSSIFLHVGKKTHNDGRIFYRTFLNTRDAKTIEYRMHPLNNVYQSSEVTHLNFFHYIHIDIVRYTFYHNLNKKSKNFAL